MTGPTGKIDSLPAISSVSSTDLFLVEKAADSKHYKATATQVGAAGGGITNLNGLTGSSQTFSAVNDTNITLTITSATTVHTFTMGWTGTLAYSRIQNVSATNRLLGRASAGAGVIEEITIGSGLTLTGTTLSAAGTGLNAAIWFGY